MVTALIYVIRFDSDGAIRTGNFLNNHADYKDFDQDGSVAYNSGGQQGFGKYAVNAKDAYSGSGSQAEQTSGNQFLYDHNPNMDEGQVPSNPSDTTIRSNHVYHISAHGANTAAYFTSKWATVSSLIIWIICSF